MTERGPIVPDLSPCRSRRHAHGGTPPRVVPGIELCGECRDRAEESLVELPELYEMCAYVLDPHRPQPRERVSGSRPHGIVLRDAVVTVRSDILGVLASWCGLVTTERGVAGPDELSIRRLTSFVQVHLTWLVAHPAAADFADELGDLADAAREVLAPDTDVEFDLGPCPRPGCAWTVRAEGHPPRRIRCDAGHEWPPEQWLLLLGRLDEHHADGAGNGNGNGKPVNGTTSGTGLPTNGHTNNGHTNNGHTNNGHANNGHANNGHANNGYHTGRPQNGHAQTGRVQAGHSQNGHPQNGHAQNGHTQNGRSQNGRAQNGHAQNGHTQNGHQTNGHPAGGQPVNDNGYRPASFPEVSE
jgi:hypothetical protein